jgi:hypothetical protein
VAKAVSLTTLIHIEPTLKSVELYLCSTCLPPWHILGQPNITLTTYLCTYPSRRHTLSGLIKERSTHHSPLTCALHDTFILSPLIQLHQHYEQIQ